MIDKLLKVFCGFFDPVEDPQPAARTSGSSRVLGLFDPVENPRPAVDDSLPFADVKSVNIRPVVNEATGADMVPNTWDDTAGYPYGMGPHGAF